MKIKGTVSQEELKGILNIVQLAKGRLDTALSDWVKIHPETDIADINEIQTMLNKSKENYDIGLDALLRLNLIKIEKGGE